MKATFIPISNKKDPASTVAGSLVYHTIIAIN